MINFFGPINHFGVGIHNYNLASACERGGKEICLIPPFGQVSFEDESVSRWLRNRSRFSAKDPSVMIFDIPFLTQFSGSPRIGFAVFETDGFTKIQLAALKSCDFLLTPSKWGKEILANHGLESTVVNEGIDQNIYPLTITPQDGLFRFVHVGKLEERKGTLQLVRCFFKALEKQDAELILHCENPFMVEGGRNEIRQVLGELGFRQAGNNLTFSRMGLRVRLTSKVATMSNLYMAADCGVFPTKGEGWGLPIQECIACGIPAIVGCWSGQSEYLGTDYPHGLAFERSVSEVASDGVWFHGDRGNWFSVVDEDLVAKIRWAFANARNLMGDQKWLLKVAQVREFSWERSATQFIRFLDTIK